MSRMYPYTFFTCAKYRYNGVTSLCFIAIFAKRKPKNLNETLATHISEMAREISFKFGMWRGLPGGHLCSETSSNRIRDLGATKV